MIEGKPEGSPRSPCLAPAESPKQREVRKQFGSFGATAKSDPLAWLIAPRKVAYILAVLPRLLKTAPRHLDGPHLEVCKLRIDTLTLLCSCC